MAKTFQLLQRLPEELLQDVLQRLDTRSLFSLNLVSRWCYHHATALIWKEVKLQDCRGGAEDNDEHDDTPLLRKLLILAKRPWIGSCVTALTHSCHLPPPAIFYELPRTPLSSSTLSPDPRTAKLVQMAVENMPNVTTLRIVFGHPNINDALLRCFFNKRRPSSIRRLWLETCRISAGCDIKLANSMLSLPLELNFTGLESVRFRRLPLRPRMATGQGLPGDDMPYNHVRDPGGGWVKMQDGAGSDYYTSIRPADFEHHQMNRAFTEDPREFEVHDGLVEIVNFANACDERIYDILAREEGLPEALVDFQADSAHRSAAFAGRGPWLDPCFDDLANQTPEFICQRERKSSSRVMNALLHSCSSTLTNLCLDWVFTKPYYIDFPGWTETFAHLFSLRFPHLKSFQFRNAVVDGTAIPLDLSLLGYSRIYENRMIIDEETGRSETATTFDLSLCGLEFMEAHPHLQCLAWPMQSFFSNYPPERHVADRIHAVIDNLGRTLVDLRVDRKYDWIGESQTESQWTSEKVSRDLRYRFIAEFAAKMTTLESIKIEGGVPRDERREIIRALHQCPLTKIVMIGVCCPIGNTWGAAGRDLGESLDSDEVEVLEPEHKDAVYGLGFKKPEPIRADFNYVPSYGWPAQPPMIHTIASYHANTIRELKFCGYKGAPVLFSPTPITHPIIAALKHFHNLESVIMSMWLNTEFEEEHRDADIIKYWLESRSPASTSLVRITDEEPEGWEKELRTKYAPDAMAWWATSFLGQYLSEQAKARPRGVHLRVSVCIGEHAGIFDMDLRIGKGSLNSDVCLGFKGPREELEPERRRQKLESRRWF